MIKESCHCRRGNERRSCLGIVAADAMVHVMCRFLQDGGAMQRSAPSVVHVTPRITLGDAVHTGAGGDEESIVLPVEGPANCNGQTTKIRRAAAQQPRRRRRLVGGDDGEEETR